MNYLTIAGHLGSDAEVRFTSNGKKVTTLRLATNVRKANLDETIWWRVTIWGEQYDKMVPYMKKGTPLVVFGEMQKPEIFTDRDGKPQISMNITASHVQFSPFGKPDRQGGTEGQAQHHEALQTSASTGQPQAYHQQPPPQSQGYHPYAPMDTAKSSAPMQSGGGTYDDEIPF